MDTKRSALPLLVVLAALLISISSGRGQSTIKSTSPAAPPTAELPVEPTGANRCRVCHESEVEGYAQSAMAHSLRRAGQEPEGTVETPEAKITMHSAANGYWQSLHSGGAETNNYRIDYVIGSGNHAAGYLLDVGDHLFQSPVAYYKSRQAYDLAPGYEGLPNPDFTRPIAEGCLFCHAGNALKISGTSNEYRSPPFSAEAISCERCHGSAEKHLSDPRAGNIVNPAKLEPAARDSICEQCHLLGVGRVLNPSKKFSDFRVGEPLEAVFTTYRNAPAANGREEKFKVISHVEQLAHSTCARMSQSKLWCGTCHDPHSKPTEPVAYFRSKCLTCHAGNFAASHPNRESDCIGCHMPRRDAKDGGHTAFTDHRIQRRPQPEEALPGDADIAAWREPAPELQKRNLGIAYINVGMERRSPPFIGRGYRLLTEVQHEFSNDSEMFTAMGSALLMAKQTSEAELAFDRALQLNPNSAVGETNSASAYLQAGTIDRAIAHLERAVAIDPLHLPAVFPLIALYKQQGNDDKAAEVSSKLSAAMEANSAPLPRTETAPDSSGALAQPAATAFKNLQVLKDIPSDQLIPSMRFVSTSLGVGCSYCHVPQHFEKDDKKPKQKAREMMRMVLAIDKNSFAGNRAVTCYSCHRGSPKPQGTPDLASELRSVDTPETAKLDFNLPTSDQVIENYIHALGGAAAIERVISRVQRGTTTEAGKSFVAELFTRDPTGQTLAVHTTSGDRISVFDRREGWSSSPGRPVHESSAAELEFARLDADLHFPLHIQRACANLQMEYPETIAGHKVQVISCAKIGRPTIKLYFDEESALLVRMLRSVDSPLGLVPTQFDYDDYRDVDGVKIPFRIRVSQPEGISTIQWQQVQQNVPIDPARFAKPNPKSAVAESKSAR